LTPVEALTTKWQRAKVGVEETGKAYEQLTARLDADWIVDWTESEKKALEDGGESLKIYGISMDTCKKNSHLFHEQKNDFICLFSQYHQWLISTWSLRKRKWPPETSPEAYHG
jgi:hypothetical protein